MQKLLEILREIGLELASFFRLLLVWLIILLGGVIALILFVCFLITKIGSWIVANPMMLVSFLVFFLVTALGITLLKRYILGREIRVEREMAAIVRKADRRIEPLFRGRHKLDIGDRVCTRLPLRPESGETNYEEVSTREGERVRLGASYMRYISNPVQYYLHRRREIDFTSLNRWALSAVIPDFRVDDIYNVPDEINATLEQFINEELHDFGLQISNYLLEEALWPETNERWLRGREFLPSPAGRYWNEVRRLRRRHH